MAQTGHVIPLDEVSEVLVSLIRNACVNDGTPEGGHEHRSVGTLQAYLGQDGTVVEPVPGRQSVVYRVPGTTPGAPTLLLIPHLDVVPARPEGWSHDPFGGDKVEGYIWGRGAVDMLNVTAAMAAVFKRYLRGATPPLPGDLIFAAVADEEAGGVYGAEHLVNHRAELVACDYLLTEVAAPSFVTDSGTALPVTVAEKGPSWRRLATRGTPGHASQPYGTHNALAPLADAMSRLALHPTPVDITPEWRAFVSGLGLEDDLESRLLDVDRIDEAIEDLAIEDLPLARWVHACTHLTVTPSLFHSGTKSNVVPDGAEGHVDLRKLPGQDETTVDDHFRKVLGSDLYEQVSIEPVSESPASASVPGGSLWEAIADAAEELTGSRRLVPALIPVATDARFFRPLGTQAYGVGLFDGEITFGEMLSMFHGHDERVSERSLDLTTEILRVTLERFGVRSVE